MAKEAKFLALDLGAESGRAVVGFFDGERIRLEEAHRFPNGPLQVGHRLYWNVLELFSQMKSGIAKAAESYGKDFAGMGIDTWGVDFGLFTSDGELLSNPRHYRDPRTDGIMEEVFRIIPRSEVFEATGIQFMQLNTLYQLFAMVRQQSPLLQCAGTLLMMPDIFNYWFTGTKASEFSEATTSQFYNPRKGRWATEILDRLGIPTHFLPEIIQPGDSLGPIVEDISNELGVSRIPVIAPATHDTGSAVAAVPTESKDYAYISSGTWSLMGVELQEPLITRQALDLNFTNEGGVACTFRFLKNIMGLWLVQECRRTWARSGQEYSYQELTDLAATEKPFAAIVDPDYSSFLHPGDMPAKIREYCENTGQATPQSHGAIIRCALDSLALKYRHVLDMLQELLGRRIEVIHIVGGGTQNKLLNQLAANTMGRPVIAGPVEATALGNVLTQAMSTGHVGSLSDIRAVVRRSCEPERYEPSADGDVEEAYGRFREIVDRSR